MQYNYVSTLAHGINFSSVILYRLKLQLSTVQNCLRFITGSLVQLFSFCMCSGNIYSLFKITPALIEGIDCLRKQFRVGSFRNYIASSLCCVVQTSKILDNESFLKNYKCVTANCLGNMCGSYYLACI